MNELTIKYSRYDSLDELSAEDAALATAARAACGESYAPFSGFMVGAAVRMDDGSVFVSSNQESEVFPSGICAERGLLYFVQSNAKQRKIRALAIASIPGHRECYPCGACRQVIVDCRNRQQEPFRVIMCGDKSATIVDEPLDLLPFTFRL